MNFNFFLMRNALCHLCSSCGTLMKSRWTIKMKNLINTTDLARKTKSNVIDMKNFWLYRGDLLKGKNEWKFLGVNFHWFVVLMFSDEKTDHNEKIGAHRCSQHVYLDKKKQKRKKKNVWPYRKTGDFSIVERRSKETQRQWKKLDRGCIVIVRSCDRRAFPSLFFSSAFSFCFSLWRLRNTMPKYRWFFHIFSWT